MGIISVTAFRVSQSFNEDLFEYKGNPLTLPLGYMTLGNQPLERPDFAMASRLGAIMNSYNPRQRDIYLGNDGGFYPAKDHRKVMLATIPELVKAYQSGFPETVEFNVHSNIRPTGLIAGGSVYPDLFHYLTFNEVRGESVYFELREEGWVVYNRSTGEWVVPKFGLTHDFKADGFAQILFSGAQIMVQEAGGTDLDVVFNHRGHIEKVVVNGDPMDRPEKFELKDDNGIFKHLFPTTTQSE